MNKQQIPDPTGLAFAKLGVCELCGHSTAHGPWSDEELAAAAEDTGVELENFSDWCDDCFVEQVGLGDVRYAASLINRPLRLRKKELLFKALLEAA